MNIADYIPTGSEHAIDRETLVNITGLNDRMVRRLIKESDELIISGGKGYFKPSSRDRWLVHRVSLREKSRAYHMSRNIKMMDRYLANCEGQIELGGVTNEG